MPVYEFVCRDCEKEFTLVLSVQEYEKRDLACPACKSRQVEHVWSHTEVVTSRKS